MGLRFYGSTALSGCEAIDHVSFRHDVWPHIFPLPLPILYF